MTVDIDRVAVETVARQIGNIVLAIELLDAAHDGVERPVHHQAGYIPIRQPEPLMRSGRMAKIERHGSAFSGRGIVNTLKMKIAQLSASASAAIPKNAPRTRTLLLVTCTYACK